MCVVYGRPWSQHSKIQFGNALQQLCRWYVSGLPAVIAISQMRMLLLLAAATGAVVLPAQAFES